MVFSVSAKRWRNSAAPESSPKCCAGHEAIDVSDAVPSLREQFRVQLRVLMNTLSEGDPDEIQAKTLFCSYLLDNIENAETMEEMHDLIEEFRAMAPRMFALKCIDGRVHGTKGKGYPPLTAGCFRTEGCKLDTDETNKDFWEHIDALVMDAERTQNGMPAVFIAYAHSAKQGGGCAAQSEGVSDKQQVIANSLATVSAHASAVRQRYGRDQVYSLHGMTDTDDMADTLIFENGTALSSASIIEECHLVDPADVFDSTFLDNQISDSAISKNLPPDAQTVRQLLDGEAPLKYNDLRTSIAMQVYLMRQIKKGNGGIVSPAVIASIKRSLDAAGDVPESLRTPLIYQTAWNIAYALYQRQRLQKMNATEREEQLEHAEQLICYGEGFELLPRNSVVLANPGREKDQGDRKALDVAMKVLQKNRKKFQERGRGQPHEPAVHVNVEVKGDIVTREQFITEVLLKLKEMAESVHQAYGDNVVLMTTYSYASEKKFYPVQVYPDSLRARHPKQRSAFPVDLSVGLDGEPKNFVSLLHEREHEYTGALTLHQRSVTA